MSVPTSTLYFKLYMLYIENDDGWMNDMRFYVFFNSISVISGRLVEDNKRPCAMKNPFTVEKTSLRAGLEPGTA